MGVIFNPIEGAFQIEQTSTKGATYIAKRFPCLNTVAVGHMVLSGAAGTVVTATGITDSRPAIGLVIRKVTPTIALVLILGSQDGFSGLEFGKPVFLSASGGMTQSPPVAPGYQQTLGVAVLDDTIFFSPNTQRILLG